MKWGIQEEEKRPTKLINVEVEILREKDGRDVIN